MRNFITPLKSNESVLQSRNSKDQKPRSPPNMFEGELGDDFLTSWNPTKMAIDVDLDLPKVQGSKSTLEKTFSSKLKMDFDFDGGFSKLSSFDIDLSFDSPPSSTAKKVKNTNLPNKLKPAIEEDDHPFDLKGFNSVDLHDISVTENGNSHESEPNEQLSKTCKSDVSPQRANGTTVDDRNQSKPLAKCQKEDTRERAFHGIEGPNQVEPDAKGKHHTESPSPLFQPDLILGQESSQGATGFVDHDKVVHPHPEVYTVTLGSNVPPISMNLSEGKAEDSSICRSHSGLPSELGTRPAGEQSERMPNNSRTNVPDEDPIGQDLAHEHIKQPEPDETYDAHQESSTVVNDKREASPSLGPPERIRTLLFDPLCTSSQNTAADGSQSEKFCHPNNRFRPRCSEEPDTPTSRRAENSNQEKVSISNPDGQTLPDGPELAGPVREENAAGVHAPLQALASKTILPKPSGDLGADRDTDHRSEVQIETDIPTKLQPVVAALLPEECMEMQKEGEEEAGSTPTLIKRSPTVYLATLGDKGSSGIPSHAQAVSSSTAQNLRAPDHVEGKQTTVREDPTPAQLKLKTIPISGNISVKTLREKSTDRTEGKLGASKRPASAILDTKNRVQLGTQQNSRIYSDEEKGEGGHDAYSRAKRGRQSGDYNGAGQSTALTPIAGKGQGFQGSGMNRVRAESQLSARALTTSKFFSTNGSRSADRKNGNQVHIPNPALERSSKLISSTTRQMKTPKLVQTSNTPLEIKTLEKKIIWAPDVTRGKGLQMNSLSRESKDVKDTGTKIDTVKRLRLQSSAPTALQNSVLEKPEVEAPKFKAGKVNRQKEMSLERVEDSAPLDENVQRKSVSCETKSKDPPVHGPADFVIESNVSTVEQSNQHAEKLDAMLKNLRNLNDIAKDLLVRALVNNNKLLMLNSPMAEDKKMKASVTEALAI